jgi:hypothetical protein
MRKTLPLIDHAGFLALLSAQFPEVIAAFDQTERGLLHCEMASFRSAAERAMDAGQLWYAERCFRLIERVYGAATPAVRNAIEISFLEDLALGELTEVRYHAVKGRMPDSLRRMMVAVNDRWK